MKGGFPPGKTERLRKTIDFQKVFLQGELFRGSHFFFYVLKRLSGPLSPFQGAGGASGQMEGGEEEAGNRIGFIVSKRVDKRAVTRNRVRRLLREAYRQNKGKLKEGRDLVVVAKKEADQLNFLETQKVLLWLFRKAGLMKVEGNYSATKIQKYKGMSEHRGAVERRNTSALEKVKTKNSPSAL